MLTAGCCFAMMTTAVKTLTLAPTVHVQCMQRRNGERTAVGERALELCSRLICMHRRTQSCVMRSLSHAMKPAECYFCSQSNFCCSRLPAFEY